MTSLAQIRKDIATGEANLLLMHSIIELQSDSRFQALQQLFQERLDAYDSILLNSKDHDLLMRTQGKKQVLQAICDYPNRQAGKIRTLSREIGRLRRALQLAETGGYDEEWQQASQGGQDRPDPRGGYGLSKGRVPEAQRGQARG